MAGKMVSMRGVSKRIAAERAQDPALARYLKQAEALHVAHDAAAERAIYARIAAGDREARTHMIESNLLLVVKIAAVYCGQGMGLLDLIGYGNIGLIYAVDTFTPSRRARFSTFASWKIRASVSRSLVDKGTTIRVAHNVVALRKRLYRLDGAALAYGQALDDSEAASALSVTPAQIRKARRAQDKAISLDTAPARAEQRHGGEVLTLAETIADPGASIEDSVISRLDQPGMREALMRGLASLTERERLVITLRFYESKTLEETGRAIHVTRERVRQIEAKCLASLRCAVDPEYAAARPVKTARRAG